MPVLFIKCPATGKAMPTGIAMQVGDNLDGFKNNMVRCVHCGQIHQWDGKDAFFQVGPNSNYKLN